MNRCRRVQNPWIWSKINSRGDRDLRWCLRSVLFPEAAQPGGAAFVLHLEAGLSIKANAIWAAACSP